MTVRRQDVVTIECDVIDCLETFECETTPQTTPVERQAQVAGWLVGRRGGRIGGRGKVHVCPVHFADRPGGGTRARVRPPSGGPRPLEQSMNPPGGR